MKRNRLVDREKKFANLEQAVRTYSGRFVKKAPVKGPFDGGKLIQVRENIQKEEGK